MNEMDRPAWWRPRGIALRIAFLSLLVTAVAVIVIAIGVLGVAQATFSRLMLEAGQSAATAHAMFDHSVLPVFIVAAVIAVAVSVLLASLLAIRLARPLDDIARAAIVDILHDDAHLLAASRVAVFRELARGKRCPFVPVDLRRGAKQDDSPFVAEQRAQTTQELPPPGHPGDVVEGKGGEDEVEGTGA